MLIEIFDRVYLKGEPTKYFISNTGRVVNGKTGKEIKWHYDGKYYNVRLTVNGKTKGYKIHRLVAKTFLPNANPDRLIEVDHLDGNKAHNEITNLEWVTPSDNCIRAVVKGLKPKSVKLTLEQVHQICSLLANGDYKNKEIAKLVGCNIFDVKNIKSKIAWRHISKYYF